MFLVFDIGGTNMRLAVSHDGKNIEEPKTLETPKDFDEGMSFFKKTALDLSDGEKIKASAGGIAGPLDGKKEMLVSSPNLPGWVKKPLKKTIEKFFDAPVYVENDAAVAGLGEALVGAGRNHAIVAYITVSTGVGGARIVDGKIDKSSQGFEPGNQIIDMEGTTLEAYISGEALRRKYGKSAENINDPDIWDDVAKKLAIGLNNLSVIWSPDIIVLGGSVMEKISLNTTKVYLKKYLKIFPESPKLELAALGDSGGLYGALSMIQNI